ncbi:MAG: ATP-binding protein [Acetobacter sp.]|nr:ATP-binding protein [Bacteroides sp.]MCM1341813.1 ATP-binding protein [Acetobacter sp.]MCM1433979.1 ATP-binding protein [Clostridiales bacterium]
MTKKILSKILAFSFGIITVTAALILVFFYSFYKKQIANGAIVNASDNEKIFAEIAVYVILIVLAAAVLSVIISIAITKSIVKPVEELGEKLLNDFDSVEAYDELKPFVKAFQEQKEKRSQTDRQKKQFTANVSHELKTPLTSIAGYAELIETGIAREEDVKPFASTIRKQALRLVTLSEDIIQLSQMDENEDNEVSFSSTDIYDTADRCIKALSINAKLRNVDLTLEGESTFIKANPTLLEEMIYNLCDNAIRYNKENGSVKVSIFSEADSTILSVSDTGIGIEEKYHERIFERFFRVDKSRSKETGGTGLGLAIVKHIAQIHNAQLKVDSAIEKGTNISIIFKK